MAFPNWNTVAPVNPSFLDPRRAKWVPILRKAIDPNEGPLNILVEGDSRATSPGGAGRYLQYCLQSFSHALFGNTPATIWTHSVTGGNTAHAFMAAMSYNYGAVGTPTKLPKADFRPGLLALSSNSFVGAEFNDGAGTWGTPSFAYTFKPSNQQGAMMYPNRNLGSVASPTWFDYTNDQVYFDVQMGTFNGSVPVQYDIMRTNTAARFDGSAFPAALDTGEWTDLSTGSTGFVTKTLGPYTLGGSAGLQLRLKGKTGSAGSFVHLGTRVRMASKRTGINWMFSGVGGYKCSDMTSTHTTAGASRRSQNPDMVVVIIDTNDIHSGAGIAATTFKTNLLAYLASLRDGTSGFGRDIPIVLLSGCYRYDELSGSAATFKTEWDQVAGVMDEIASTYPMVMHINLRRITEYLGFNSTNTDMGGSRPVGATFVGDFSPVVGSATAGQFGAFRKTAVTATTFLDAQLWKALNTTDTWTATEQSAWPTAESNGAKAYSAFQDWYLFRWWVSDGYHSLTNTAGTYTITAEDAVHLSPEACWTIAPLILFNIFGFPATPAWYAGPLGAR